MAAAVRAALYLRVSTGRQADNDLSIPDQRRQAKGYCTSRGWEIAVGSSRVPPARASEARRLGNTHAITRCGEPLQLHEPMQIQSWVGIFAQITPTGAPLQAHGRSMDCAMMKECR